MNDTLHKFDNARADLRATGDYLLDLSEAFERTGNELMASQLSSLAHTVSRSEQTCNSCMSAMVNERFQAAREASDNILMTALAVVAATGDEAG